MRKYIEPRMTCHAFDSDIVTTTSNNKAPETNEEAATQLRNTLENSGAKNIAVASWD